MLSKLSITQGNEDWEKCLSDSAMLKKLEKGQHTFKRSK